jgi:hypothetical protein
LPLGGTAPSGQAWANIQMLKIFALRGDL